MHMERTKKRQKRAKVGVNGIEIIKKQWYIADSIKRYLNNKFENAENLQK